MLVELVLVVNVENVVGVIKWSADIHDSFLSLLCCRHARYDRSRYDSSR